MIGNPISPDDQRAFNLRLITTLESLGVIYAVGGSVAAMMYSKPRFTIDVDVMVSAPLKQLNRLVREVLQLAPQIPPQWQSDTLRALTAVARLRLPEQPLNTLALLAFVAAQPISYQHLCAEAQQLLNASATQLLPADVAMAQQQGQALSLDEAIALAQTYLK